MNNAAARWILLKTISVFCQFVNKNAMLTPDLLTRDKITSAPITGMWADPAALQLPKIVEEQAQIELRSLDLKTGAKTFSPGMYRITGLKEQDGLGALRRLFHPEDWNAREEMKTAIAAGLPVHREFRIIRPDRTVR